MDAPNNWQFVLWKTRGGLEIPIGELEPAHLKNILKMIARISVNGQFLKYNPMGILCLLERAKELEIYNEIEDTINQIHVDCVACFDGWSTPPWYNGDAVEPGLCRHCDGTGSLEILKFFEMGDVEISLSGKGLLRVFTDSELTDGLGRKIKGGKTE